ncbi:exodeoxyribonuclease III [Candidatus Saccharibacteria bacterium]|nr:exodeoxyribonuclease III [Candidatus Saccharibacteria bacterium]
MKLYSWNVNGIRATLSKGDFQRFIQEQKPDVLCLQETKAHRGQVDIDLPDYEEYWNSAERPGYSGTAIFTKQKPLQVINGFADGIAEKFKLVHDGYGDPTGEGRVISAEFNKLWVVTVYTPNSKRGLERLGLRHKQWDPALIEHLKTLEKTKPVLICGDFNAAHQAIDLANPKQNEKNAGYTPEEREGFDNLIKAGFVDIFRHQHPDQTGAYTWWTWRANARARNIGWRIDYWLCSKSLLNKVTESQIHPEISGSDHCPISIKVEV